MKRLLVCVAVGASLLVPVTVHAGVPQHVDFVSTSGFNPELKRVHVMQTVDWANATGSPHTATSYEGVFDTGTVEDAATSAQIPFDAAGRFEYYCKFHGGMRGVLAVAQGPLAGNAPDLDARPGYGNLAAAAYTLGGPSVPVSPGLTLSDSDGGQIAQAIVGVRGNFRPGDILEFTDTAEIDGTYNANTGGLTLTGATTVGAYEQALRAIRFRTSSGAETKRVSFGVQDAAGDNSPLDFRDVVVSAPATNGGGGGGTTTPPPSPNPITSPVPLPVDRVPNDAPNRPSLRLSRTSFAVDARGRVTLVFTTDPGLRGTVDLAPAGRATRFGRASFRAGPRGAVRVRVRLSSAARRALKRARTRRLRARIVVRSGTQSTSRTVTLRRRR